MIKSDALLRDYQWVTERLAVGSAVTTTEQVQALVSDGITHVMDCRVEKPGQLYRRIPIDYLPNPTLDDGKAKTNDWFFKGFEFYERAMKLPGTKMLVHCRFGMSRAPSMAYAILRITGIAPQAALRQLRDARPVGKVTYVDDADRAALAWRKRSIGKP